MRKIFLFMMVTLDGYFEGVDHDISWHNVDGEFGAFADGQLKEVDTLLFGRRTYDMMAAFWPKQGATEEPSTATLMNKVPKIVASHEDFKPEWENTTVVSHDVEGAIRRLKEAPGKDIAIFGSNNFCVSLMEKGLVDEFRIMVNPVAIGKGSSLFTGLSTRTKFSLKKTREFKSGNILHYYVTQNK